MNKLSRPVTALLLIVAALPAAARQNAHSFTLNLAATSDDDRFAIASDPTGTATPNVLSDVRWEDVESWRLSGNLRLAAGRHFRIIGDLGIGLTTDGDGTASDYLGDDRTNEFSRVISTVDGKADLDATLALGWEWRKTFSVPLWRIGKSDKRVAFASDMGFTPFLGYSYARKNVEFSDGVQLVPESGSFPGLAGHYEPEWHGPMVGVEGDFRVAKRIFVYGGYRYWGFVEYSAEAEWPIREPVIRPERYSNSADGNGSEFSFGLRWHLNDRQSIGIHYAELEMSANNGEAVTTTSVGTPFETRLNEVEWNRRSVSLSFEWRF